MSARCAPRKVGRSKCDKFRLHLHSLTVVPALCQAAYACRHCCSTGVSSRLPSATPSLPAPGTTSSSASSSLLLVSGRTCRVRHALVAFRPPSTRRHVQTTSWFSTLSRCSTEVVDLSYSTGHVQPECNVRSSLLWCVLAGKPTCAEPGLFAPLTTACADARCRQCSRVNARVRCAEV